MVLPLAWAGSLPFFGHRRHLPLWGGLGAGGLGEVIEFGGGKDEFGGAVYDFGKPAIAFLESGNWS